MKLKNYIYVALASVLALSSCASSWTEPEAETYENQKDLKRLIPFLEAKTVADLTPTMAKHYEQVREYRKTDHVLGFGWFGNWSATGDDPMGYLKALPDSVDMVSLWGKRGSLTEAQKDDLRYFQEIKGGKAMLCWIVQDTGEQLTPADAPEPTEDEKKKGISNKIQKYWLHTKGGGDYIKAAEAYADAIADTIAKYNLDGFDIDLEPGYGHGSRWSKLARSYPEAGPNAGQNQHMHFFIKRLYDRFREMDAKDGKRRIIAVDGEPYTLSNETSKMVDYYILQAYWESTSSAALSKANRLSSLDNYQRKTILTVEFEQGWRTGGIGHYRSSKYPELNGKQGVQIFDYATLDYANGIRLAGIGTYHMEYDKSGDIPYRWLRAALDRANKQIPGKFKLD